MKTKNSFKKGMKSVPLVFILLISLFFTATIFTENGNENKNTKIISPEWNSFSTVSMQDSLTPGETWTGEPGITITVAELMEREAMLPEGYYTHPRDRVNKDIEEGEYPEKQVNPAAPDVSRWPPPDQNEKENQTEPSQTDNPQTLGANFLGPNLSTAGYIPPDSQGDVGPTQVLVCSNGRITVYSKTGVVGGLNVGLDAFFSSVDNGTGTSDPHIRYDRLSGRWFIVGINLPASGANRIMIARSSGSTITNSSSFTFFQFQQDAVGTPGIDAGGFADYPTLGVDKFALYVGANMFNPSTHGYTGFVINKANLLSGSLTVTAFRALGTNSIEGPYVPQGVDNDDPSATEGYFIGVSNFAFSKLIIRRVSNPGGTPSISSNLSITVPTTVYPETVPQSGSGSRMDAIDDRLFAAEIHKNKITGAITLWTAHNIEVNASGVASTTGNRDAGRWYEISNLTTTPTLNQSGTLFDPAASNPRYYWIPSCAMSGQGHMSIGTSTAGLLEKAQIYVAGRFRTDATGNTQTSTLAQSSTTIYTLSDGSRVRWGDYSQTVVDPTDDMTMWTFQEYCNSTNSWGVRAIQLKAPAPATPSSSDITNIASGLPSVNIVITGTSSGGTEFFDPGADVGGPGFANHIAASISGSVTVNSITFNSPTQVTLNISTVGSPAGQKNITITNPDGQTSTGNNLINIQSAPPVLSLTSLVEGFYDQSTDLMVQDTMRVYARNNFAPYTIVDSGIVFLSNTGFGSITFNSASNGVNYYFQLKHRSSLETWSSSPGQSFVSSALSYDFTTADSKAYGNNMPQIDASPVKYGVYNGDINQDGVIDGSDVLDVFNDASNFASGYVRTDLNGDNLVELSDILIVYNNNSLFVQKVIP